MTEDRNAQKMHTFTRDKKTKTNIRPSDLGLFSLLGKFKKQKQKKASIFDKGPASSENNQHRANKQNSDAGSSLHRPEISGHVSCVIREPASNRGANTAKA